MGLIYLDSCLVIYFVEEHPQHAPAVREALKRHGEAGFAISDLVQLECLVGPLRAGDMKVAQSYEDFFVQLTNLDMPSAVYRSAAQLRASHGLKTPDALHVACAQHHGCDALWTADDRLRGMGDFVRRI